MGLYKKQDEKKFKKTAFTLIIFLALINFGCLTTNARAKAFGITPSTIHWGNLTSSTIVSSTLRITPGKSGLFNSFSTLITGFGSSSLSAQILPAQSLAHIEYFPLNIRLNPRHLRPGTYQTELQITPKFSTRNTISNATIPGVNVKIDFTIVTSSYREIILKENTLSFPTANILHIQSALENTGTLSAAISSLFLTSSDQTSSIFIRLPEKIIINPKTTVRFELTTSTSIGITAIDQQKMTVSFLDDHSIVVSSTNTIPRVLHTEFQISQQTKKYGGHQKIIYYLLYTLAVTCGIIGSIFLFNRKK